MALLGQGFLGLLILGIYMRVAWRVADMEHQNWLEARRASHYQVFDVANKSVLPPRIDYGARKDRKCPSLETLRTILKASE